MAKRNAAPAAAATPAGAPSGIAKGLADRVLGDRAIDMGKQQPDVIEWDAGNGTSTFQQGTLPPEPAGEGANAGDANGTNGEVVENDTARAAATEGNQGDATGEPGTVSPAPTQPATTAKPKGAAARQGAFAALEAERARVTLEQQARQNQERADAATAELARVKAMPLREKLKWIEANKEELAEAVLVGGDDVADLPEKPTVKPSPELEELRGEVAALKADAAARGSAAAQQAISAGHQVVVEALKDVASVPMVKGVRDVVVDGQYVQSGVDLTLKTAHQAWLQAGRAGHPRDYVPGAAEVVEAYLREKRPDIAAYMVPAAGAGGGQRQDPPATTGGGGSASIGKRTGARPDAQPKELPTDRHQRDMQIKREMGWV